MGKLQDIVCNAFIESKAKEAKATLLSFLPKSRKDAFAALQVEAASVCEGFDLSSSLIESVHYTWFTPFLRTLVADEVKIFLSVLPEETAEKLQKALLVQGPLPPPSPALRSFLQNKLTKALVEDGIELLPIQALPPSSLNCLLDLSLKELRLLIEFLGLHDLASEIKQIIDTVKLKKIHSILSKEKTFFLQLLTRKKESILFKKMGLTNWTGDIDLLAKLLQKRGMNRLAKALYAEDPSLAWHIKHRLSDEEGVLFSSLHKKLEQSKAYGILSSQILDVLSFFKTHNMQVDP